MPKKLALLGASGKLGHATLSALLTHSLLPPSSLVVTSSSPSGALKLQPFTSQGVELRPLNWDSPPAELEAAFEGCDRLFLISSARVEKDFDEAGYGLGREGDHFRVIDAAVAAGVKRIYYSSLGFANPSASRVMKAHERTEGYLAEKAGVECTVIREGLYSESWPLYFGHWDEVGGEREEVVVGGDGKVNWTSIPDLGLANALILADGSEKWVGRTVYLAQGEARSLRELAGIISRVEGREVGLKVVSREEHERYYVDEKGMDGKFVRWWSKTYDALRAGECFVKDATLEELLSSRGVEPRSFEQTVEEMLR